MPANGCVLRVPYAVSLSPGGSVADVLRVMKTSVCIACVHARVAHDERTVADGCLSRTLLPAGTYPFVSITVLQDVCFHNGAAGTKWGAPEKHNNTQFVLVIYRYGMKM